MPTKTKSFIMPDDDKYVDLGNSPILNGDAWYNALKEKLKGEPFFLNPGKDTTNKR